MCPQVCSLIAGAGLGTSYSSFTQIGDVMPGDPIGQAKVRVYCNMATGNLYVNPLARQFKAANGTITLGYVYNNLAAGGDNWHFTLRSLADIPAQPSTKGTHITLCEEDGHRTTYSYEPALGTYLAPVGNGGGPAWLLHDASSNTWHWYNPNTGAAAKYDATGLLQEVTDARGLITTYSYENRKLVSVLDPGLIAYDIHRSASSQGVKIEIWMKETDAVLMTTYFFDSSGTKLLSMVIGSNQGSGYKIEFGYLVDDIGRLNLIKQSDTSQFVVYYNDDCTVQALANGPLEYSEANTLDITCDRMPNPTKATIKCAGVGQQLICRFDEQHRLIAVQRSVGTSTVTSTDDTTYKYSEIDGQIQTITRPNGATETFLYGPLGQPLIVTGANQQKRFYYHDSSTGVLNQEQVCLYHGDIYDPLVTRYVYDTDFNHIEQGNRVLRFMLQPSGRVTEYLCDAKGACYAKKLYLVIYDVSQLGADQSPTLAEMEQWVKARTPQQFTLVEYFYDRREFIIRQTDYAHVDATTGEGVFDAAAGNFSVRRIWDGQVRHRVADIFGHEAGEITQDLAEYDDLCRQTKLFRSFEYPERQDTFYQYDDANRTTVVIYPNGRKIVTQHDVRWVPEQQQVIALAADGSTQQRTSVFKSDYGCRRIKTIEPDGQVSYSLYDLQNRVVYEVAADGALTEYVYDVRNGYKTTIHYATLIPLDQMEPYGLLPTPELVKRLHKADPDKDRASHEIYDRSGRMHYSVDAANYITERRYDSLDRLIAIISYATPLTTEQLAKIKSRQELGWQPDVSKDRFIQYFYDVDSNKIAEQNAAGYVTYYRYDAAGRVVEKIVYASPTDHVATIDKVVPVADPAHDSHTYYYYDGRNQCVAEINAEGAMIEREFNTAGKLSKETHYVTKIAGDPSHETDWTKLRPQSSAEDLVTTHQCDRVLRQVLRADTRGLVQRTEYNVADDATSIKQTDSAGGATSRSILNRYDGWQQITAQCPPLVADIIIQTESDPKLTPEQKKEKIARLWQESSQRTSYTASGLKISAIDPEGHTTLYFYDHCRRLRYTVDPTGAIKENIYNNFGEILTTRAYANVLSAAQLKTLTGGYLSTDVQQLFTSMCDANKDRIVQFNYDYRGLKVQQVDPEGYTTTYAYDAFGNCVTEHQPLAATAPSITVQHTFDVRGLETQTTTHSTDLTVMTRAEYHSHLAKKTKAIGAAGHSTTTEYDRLGQPIRTTDQLGVVCTTTYDALQRVAQEVDGKKALTRHLYQLAKRAHTVIIFDATGKPLAQFSELRNVWRDVVANIDGLGNKRIAVYAADGQILLQQDELGNTTITGYNLCGRRVHRMTPDKVVTQYILDAAGNVRQEIIDVGGASLTTTFVNNAFGEHVTWTDPRNVVHCQVFERRGLVTALLVDPKTASNSQGLDLVTNNVYLNARGRLTAITQGDGSKLDQHLRVISFDSLGREITSTVDPQGLQISTQKRYDACNRVIAEVDANGEVARYFYDAAGHKRFSVNPLGAVIEFIYDANGKIASQRDYALIVDTTKLSDASLLTDIQALVQVSQDDKISYTFYDQAGRIRFTANSFGAITEKTYNAASREIATRQYNIPINPTTLPNLTTDQLAELVTVNADDRISYRILDAAGQERFTIDAGGYIAEKRFDAAGHTITKIVYALPVENPAAIAQLPVEQVLAQIQQDPVTDRVTYQVFNIKGDPIYTVDPEGAVTRYSYDENGNLTETCIFATKITTPEKYEELLTLLNALVADPNKDRVTKYTFDAANRKVKVTNALGDSDVYTLTAVNRQIAHIDRAGEVWRCAYDSANRLATETSPQIYIESLSATTAVVKAYELDRAGNQTKITFAAGTDEARTVRFVHDAIGQLAQMIMDNVPVAGEADPVSVSKITIYNARRLPIVTQNEAGALHFMIYDAENRVIYEVNAEGAVIKYEYNTFGNVRCKIRYATALHDINLTDYAQTGLTAAIIVQHLTSSANDLISETTYDHRGLSVSVKTNEVFYYIPDSQAPRFGTARPETRYRYNAAGQQIYTAVLVDPQKNIWTETITWFDRNGHKIATSDEIYRVKRLQIDAFGNVVARTEFTNVLTTRPIPTMSIVDLDRAVVASDQDRHFVTEYDLIGQQTADIQCQVVTQTLVEGASQTDPLTFQDLPAADAVKRYRYNKIGKIVATTYEDGSIAYAYFNARGDRIASTEVPRQTYDASYASVTLIPLTDFGVNCHGQTVRTTMYHQGTAAADLSALPTPKAPDDDDRVTQEFFDIRGLSARTIDAEGVTVTFTRTRTGKVQAQSQPLTNWKGHSSETETHTVEQRYVYDILDREVSQSHVMDGEVQYTTQRCYNVFGQSVAEGPGGELFPAFSRYVVGQEVYCNDQGVVTIKLFDLANRQTATLQSPTDDLSQVTYAQFSEMLSTWGTDIARLERREMYRDLAGRVITYNTTPPYGHPDLDGLEDMPINVVASSAHVEIAPNYTLTWFNLVETNLIAPKLIIWPKSDPTVRHELAVITSRERSGVDITAAGLPSDVYEYQIDYYLRDPMTGAASGKAKYRTKGVVQLDTGISQNSTALVAVVEEDGHTVKLAGKTTDLSKVELWQDGKYVATIPVTVDPKTKQLIVDLNAYPSASYQLRPIYALNPSQLRSRQTATMLPPSVSDAELTLPFIVHTNIPAPSPLGQGVDCYVYIMTLKTHGQVVWNVPLPLRALPIKITCEYLDARGQTQLHEDDLDAATKKGEYTDEYGDKLICNTEFAVAPAKIVHLQLAVKIGTQWVMLINEDTYVPPPPSLRTAVAATDQDLIAADARSFSPERTWQLHKARKLQHGLAVRRKVQMRQRVQQEQQTVAQVHARHTGRGTGVLIEPITEPSSAEAGTSASAQAMCPRPASGEGIIAYSSFLPTTTMTFTSFSGLLEAHKYEFSYLDYAMDRMAKWKVLNISQMDCVTGFISIDATAIVTGIYPCKLVDLTTNTTIFNGKFTLDRGYLVFANDPLPPIQPVMTAPQRHVAYDSWNQEIELTDTLGNKTNKAYSVRGQLLTVTAPSVEVCDEHGQRSTVRPVTSYGYNQRGVQIAVRDANGHVTASYVNAAGQKLQIVLGDGTRQYTYGHDCFGQEICHRDCRGHVWTSSHDHRGHVTVTKVPSLRATTYSYNELGLRREQINAAGLRYAYIFNSRGDIVETWAPAGDDSSWTRSQYDHNHQPLSVQTRDGTLSWERDYFGTELRRTDIRGAVYTSGYDFKRQLVTTQSGGGQHGTYLPFSPFGAMFSVGGETGNPGQSMHMEYTAGQLRTMRDLATGKTIVRGYDTENRPITKSITWRDGTLIQNIATQYNAQGRIIRSDDVNSTFFFTYDPVGNRRCEWGTVYVDGSACAQSDWFLYDAANRVVIDRGFFDHDHIGINAYQGTVACYDGDFRVSEEKAAVGKTTLTYDMDGRLTATDAYTGVGSTRRTYDTADRVYHYEEPGYASSDIAYDAGSRVYHSHQVQAGNWSDTAFDSFICDGTAQHQYTQYSGDGNVRDNLYTGFVGFSSLQLASLGGTRTDDHGVSPYASVRKFYDANGAIEGIVGAESDETNGFMVTDESGKVLLRWRVIKKVRGDWLFAQVYGITIINNKYIYDINDSMLANYTAAFDCIFSRPISLYADLYQYLGYLDRAAGINFHQHSFAPGLFGAGRITDMHLSGDYFQDVSVTSTEARRLYDLKQKGWDHREGPMNCYKMDYFLTLKQAYETSRTASQASSFLAMIPQTYVVVAGDTFSVIAKKIFGYEGYAGIIAEHNGWSSCDTPTPGLVLTVPQILPSINAAGANTPYERFVSLILGAIYPHLETPQPPDDDDGCGSVIFIVVIVVVAIVTCIVAGPEIIATMSQAIGTALSVGPAVATAIAYAAVGALSSAIQQGLAVAFGIQNGFSFQDVLMAGLESGVTMGILGKLGLSMAGELNYATMFAIASANITSQLAEMALGMRNKFDIGQAIVQTAGYGLGAKLQKVPSLAVRDAIKAFGTTVLSSVISGHRLDLVQLAANFAGNYAQDKTAEIMQDHQRQEAERAIEQHQEAKQDARRTAVARQDRTTQEGREVAPTASHRSQDEETTVPTTASRRRSFFGDDQETRSTLADASRATRAKAATSALATATTRHSDILTDISTDDAILDATREALSGTFATPDSQALVSLRGGEVGNRSSTPSSYTRPMFWDDDTSSRSVPPLVPTYTIKQVYRPIDLWFAKIEPYSTVSVPGNSGVEFVYRRAGDIDMSLRLNFAAMQLDSVSHSVGYQLASLDRSVGTGGSLSLGAHLFSVNLSVGVSGDARTLIVDNSWVSGPNATVGITVYDNPRRTALLPIAAAAASGFGAVTGVARGFDMARSILPASITGALPGVGTMFNRMATNFTAVTEELFNFSR